MLDRTTSVDGGAEAPIYHPVQPVQCISHSDTKERKRNMKYAMSKARDIPRLQTIAMVHRGPLAIICGGPTLNKTYHQVKKFKDVMSCGSAHDHVLRLGIRPTYHIECDPMKTQIVNYTKVDPGCAYLISSRCHKSMFQRLEDHHVRLWHMWEEDIGKPAYNGEPAFVCGATVGLASVPLAIAMGYNDFHFFGFDSSFPNEKEHHAYPQPETAKMMTARVGDAEKGREFLTTATWLGQAQQFEQMQNHWGSLFKVTIHGDSLMSEMQKCRKKQQEKQ